MAKFLIDTSVWIDFFRGRLGGPVYENLCEGIRLGAAIITDIIRSEVLVGARTREQFLELRQLLSSLESLRITDHDLPVFEEFVWDLSQKGLKGKYTDASIAFLAFRHKIPLLSFDRYFSHLAQRGIITLIEH